MKKHVFISALLAAAIFGTINAGANAGMGVDADPGASMDSAGDRVVYCVDDLDFKSYIKEDDYVLVTYKAGTIFKVDSILYKDGKESGWAASIVKDKNKNGGEGNGFFELDKVKTYGGKDNVRVEISEDGKDVTIRVPDMNGEEFVYYSSDGDALYSTGDEVVDGDFVVHMHAKDDYTEDATVTLDGYLDGEKYDQVVVTLYGTDVMDFSTVTIAPLDFNEIKDKIDRYEEMYTEDGETEKVAVLKDGRRIDMNGYKVIGIADDAVQMHDGRVLYQDKVSK